jgi:hypothetical protein
MRKRTMACSRIISVHHHPLEGVQSAGAITALHSFINARAKRRGFFGLIKRLLHGMRPASGSRQSGRNTNHSTGWRQIMLTLMPSIGVGLAGSLVIAIALAADWYIWRFRYWMSGASTAPSAKHENVIHMSSACSRDLVAHRIRPMGTSPLATQLRTAECREQY